jgi:hypothetical protein
VSSSSLASDLTVFVPTRTRPKNLLDFGGNFYDTSGANSHLIFILDEDDDQLGEYLKRNNGRFDYEVVAPTKRGMVEALNIAFSRRLAAGDLGYAVGFMGDDHRPRTEGWDFDYIVALESLGSGFVYGNDLLQGELMPTQVAFTTDIAAKLGWMAPPVLWHLDVDLVWLELGKALDRITYLPDTIVEHMHPLAGKARSDRGYRVANSTVMARHDGAAYARYMETDLAGDVAKLKEMLNEGSS